MKDLLKRGLAVHHSGILPILKEVGFSSQFTNHVRSEFFFQT